MPQINLGNIKAYSEGAGLYTHTYDETNHIHNFVGNGKFGYCKCVANYSVQDTIHINGANISSITIPTFIIKNAWITFIIEDGVFYMLDKAEMFHIPNGELVTPVNDPEIWCACAGINWKEIGSPDARTLAASSTYCPQLINNPNAFAYYRRSNEIIQATILNTNIISCIENTEYYTTPYMTAINTPAGYSVATKDSQYTSNGGSKAWGAFANAHYIGPSSSTVGSWAMLEIPEPIWPYKMDIYAQNGGNFGSYLADAIFNWQCSNDGTNWVDLHAIPSLSQTSNVLYTFYNTAGVTEKYKYFRLYVSQASNKTYWSCGKGQVSGIL